VLCLRYRYLRDTVEGLSSKDDPVLFESCLNAIESQIRAHPPDLEDIGESIARRLLNAQNHFALDNFESVRQTSLVALLVELPSKVLPHKLDNTPITYETDPPTVWSSD
jgi:hypothetical protein